MLENVNVDPVVAAAAIVGPDVVLREADEVERLFRQPIRTVGPCLRVRERCVHPRDAADLALHVRGGAMVALVQPGRDPHPLPGAIPHPPSLAPSSPTASTPFSVRIVSTE